MAKVYLAFGSNLGDRRGNILEAANRLNSSGVHILRISSLIETDPVGGPLQGPFLNAVALAETELSPRVLLDVCAKIEQALGRLRGIKDGPRTIDLDILMYDDLVMDEPGLIIPHPRMRERDFVMRPLKEIAPDFFVRDRQEATGHEGC